MRHVLALLFIATSAFALTPSTAQQKKPSTSVARIKALAGEDIEKAHFLPRDREFLIEPDEHVRHYDVTSAP